MSDLFASLNGQQIVSGSITIPLYGCWTADISLASSAPIPEKCTLTVGALTLVGFAYRMASFAGTRSVRLVGGYGGWRQPVTSRSYSYAGGIRLSLVLNDVASEVGEKIALQTDQQIGSFFIREAGPAQRVLRQLGGPLWWIRPDGVTQLGTRPSDPIVSQFDVIGWSGGKGTVSIATETYQDWMPGRTFTSPTITTAQTISMVTHEIDNDGKLRTEVLTAP